MWKLICIMAILCLAAACDLITGKIYNLIILIGLVSGSLFSIFGGEPAVSLYALGVLTPLVLFPFYCMRLIGAGDVKLFMVVGGYMGLTKFIRGTAWILLGILIWTFIYFYGSKVRDERIEKRRKVQWQSLMKKKFPMAPGIVLGVILYYLSSM